MLKTALFDTVPQKDHLALFPGGKVNGSKVAEFLELKKPEIASATGVPKSSIRFDQKIPHELLERLRQWATLLNLVASHFYGDAKKTALWFQLPNPLLGNASPRDMIRFGRFEKLWNFVVTSLGENQRS